MPIDRRTALLAAALVLAPHVIAAQGISAAAGRVIAEHDWSIYRVGLHRGGPGPMGLDLHGLYLDEHGRLDRRAYGLGADVTMFQGGRGGPYLVGGVAGGMREDDRTEGAPILSSTLGGWWSWSAGMGYEVFPLRFLSLSGEGRWRDQPSLSENGIELSLRLGLRFGGRRGPADDDPPPSPPSVASPEFPAASAPVASAPDASAVAAADASGAPLAGAALTAAVIGTANSALGTRYQFGGEGEAGDGFDCSGLIQFAYGAHGIELPRRSVDQAREGRAVQKSLEALRPGDILTFANRGRRVTHVGLYLGDGRFIHSASRGVQVSLLGTADPNGRWWFQRWVGVRRIVE